jgi:carboxyl-terminal processing protease
MLFSYERPRPAPIKAKPVFGLDDKDVLLYLEAINQIKEKASSPIPNLPRPQIIEQSLRAYLTQQGHCCDYLTREEYGKFKGSLKEGYVGVGMEIKQDRDGRIICLPQPDSAAARAGIARGDQLKKIDGVPVDGKSIFAVTAMARGKPGTEVNFIVAAKGGAEKQVRVIRSTVALRSVSKRFVDRRPVVELAHFTRDTSVKMREILGSWEEGAPIIVDLRGNGGGDLHAAIDSAMLFLEKGKRIVSVETPKGTNVYESKDAAVNLKTPVYLWQDEATASAAEVFIAALVDNHRAVSIGKRTAGKATREEIIELSDGSALILATGTLKPPSGLRYQGSGLAPGHELKEDPIDTRDYVTKVQELSGAKRTGFLTGDGRWRTAERAGGGARRTGLPQRNEGADLFIAAGPESLRRHGGTRERTR